MKSSVSLRKQCIFLRQLRTALFILSDDHENNEAMPDISYDSNPIKSAG